MGSATTALFLGRFRHLGNPRQLCERTLRPKRTAWQMEQVQLTVVSEWVNDAEASKTSSKKHAEPHHFGRDGLKGSESFLWVSSFFNLSALPDEEEHDDRKGAKFVFASGEIMTVSLERPTWIFLIAQEQHLEGENHIVHEACVCVQPSAFKSSRKSRHRGRH